MSTSRIIDSTPTKKVSDKEKVPKYVIVLAKLIPLLVWDDGENLSKGEIEKFHFVESCKNKYSFNQQVVGQICDEGNVCYDAIWRHISNDWFKLIGKSLQRSC